MTLKADFCTLPRHQSELATSKVRIEPAPPKTLKEEVGVTGCRPLPPSPRERRQKSFKRGNYPPPPHWDISQTIPNLRHAALSADVNSPINESAELTQGTQDTEERELGK